MTNQQSRWGIWCVDPEDDPYWFGAWLRSEEPIWAEPVFYRTRKEARVYRDEMAESSPHLKLTVKRVKLSAHAAQGGGNG